MSGSILAPKPGTLETPTVDPRRFADYVKQYDALVAACEPLSGITLYHFEDRRLARKVVGLINGATTENIAKLEAAIATSKRCIEDYWSIDGDKQAIDPFAFLYASDMDEMIYKKLKSEAYLKYVIRHVDDLLRVYPSSSHKINATYTGYIVDDLLDEYDPEENWVVYESAFRKMRRSFKSPPPIADILATMKEQKAAWDAKDDTLSGMYRDYERALADTRAVLEYEEQERAQFKREAEERAAVKAAAKQAAADALEDAARAAAAEIRAKAEKLVAAAPTLRDAVDATLAYIEAYGREAAYEDLQRILDWTVGESPDISGDWMLALVPETRREEAAAAIRAAVETNPYGRKRVEPAYTLEDLKGAFRDYAKKYGPAAVQADGQEIFRSVLGAPPENESHWRMSLVRPAMYADLIDACKRAMETNRFNREKVGAAPVTV